VAEKAIAASGSPHSVIWADVERQAIVRMIEQSINHCSTDGDAAAPGALDSETLSENILRVIAEHSPGVLSQQDQQAIDQDIKKLVRHCGLSKKYGSQAVVMWRARLQNLERHPSTQQ